MDQEDGSTEVNTTTNAMRVNCSPEKMKIDKHGILATVCVNKNDEMK